MRIFIYLAIFVSWPLHAAISGSYLAVSAGSSYEYHRFDIWNGPSLPGRRDLGGNGFSRDQAIALGFHRAAFIGYIPVDLEFELFERRNTSFTAAGRTGTYPTRIRTNSALVAMWIPLQAQKNWRVQVGAGIGARHSTYVMSGPGVAITTTDRAPYLMVGMKAIHQLDLTKSIFAELRVHTRPNFTLPGNSGVFTGPLEHNSAGLTLRIGLQFKFGPYRE